MVRDRAIMALDVLLVCRRECFETLFKYGDDLVKELRKRGWKPGSADCLVLFNLSCAACPAPEGVAVQTPPIVPGKPIEAIPAPKTAEATTR
jgi:hypothetical protein